MGLSNTSRGPLKCAGLRASMLFLAFFGACQPLPDPLSGVPHWCLPRNVRVYTCEEALEVMLDGDLTVEVHFRDGTTTDQIQDLMNAVRASAEARWGDPRSDGARFVRHCNSEAMRLLCESPLVEHAAVSCTEYYERQ